MKFSALFIAAAAVLCVSANAQGLDEVDAKVKGIALVSGEHASLRSVQFTKGEALVHSRSENLATSNIAVPDESNPYKSKERGIVGNALSMPANPQHESSSSGAAVPLAIVGCAVAAVGIAGFVFMKKRAQKQEEEEADEPAVTPATGCSPSHEVADFKDEMNTPVAV